MLSVLLGTTAGAPTPWNPDSCFSSGTPRLFADRGCCRGLSLLFAFRPRSKQFEKHLIALTRKLVDGASRSFLRHAGDDRLLHLRCEFGEGQDLSTSLRPGPKD